MIITTITELRLHSPSHALDSIDSLTGFIDNSEHDFLEEKLGTPLYERLQQWYNTNSSTMSNKAMLPDGSPASPFNQLCLLAQRCVAFDALGRAIGMQVVSVNNSGVNVATAEDYERPKKEDIETYRTTCSKESHAALNRLLRQLETWAQTDGNEEQTEIVTLWQQSSYYYLAAGQIIPSCTCLQSYLNIYDSREKFIQLLPDLRFIQEEIIGDTIGSTLLAQVVDYVRSGTVPTDMTEAVMSELVHRLRKVEVALLIGRTSVLKTDKEKRLQAHNDGVRMMESLTKFISESVPSASPSTSSGTAEGTGPSTSSGTAEGNGGGTTTNAGSNTTPTTGSNTTPTTAVPEPVEGSKGAKESEAACWTPVLF